ncbi:hypothetical protein [Desulfosporosinus acidiphilus]|nr:hypothetical protein [Desulfosporosinus acidiphilus]
MDGRTKVELENGHVIVGHGSSIGLTLRVNLGPQNAPLKTVQTMQL